MRTRKIHRDVSVASKLHEKKKLEFWY